ncbi:uncharacterized protein CLUP02_01860 [Colletotrichum lupini]|uniref:Uncharacterized protein n=1 Tax=Colletotrichum lupini TaxID=145971 RepID=A0A9Q8SD88_9PEZI|nr:uncharacterized protein CLUP02_01860 [Colletotrichum lupini]UQC75207.1 hypothetical protein CLUP02_01860 [Colletotrichum lupini]
MCLGAVVVLLVMTRDRPAEVAMILSNDTSCFVACSLVFRGQSPLAATSRPFGCRFNAEDDIVPKVTSADASGRGSINLVLVSRVSFSLLLVFQDHTEPLLRFIVRKTASGLQSATSTERRLIKLNHSRLDSSRFEEKRCIIEGIGSFLVEKTRRLSVDLVAPVQH